MGTHWIWRSELQRYADLVNKDVDTYMKESKNFSYKETDVLTHPTNICYIRTLKKK